MKIFTFISLCLCLLIVISQTDPTFGIGCVCSKNSFPVCGSNGKTYYNLCLLSCDRRYSPHIRIDHFGNFYLDTLNLANTYPASGYCNVLAGPVSLFLNDANSLFLRFNKLNMKIFSFISLCLCLLIVISQTDPTFGIGCVCSKNLFPVCGTNGKTYYNPCLLNCDRRHSPRLKIHHEGNC
ncbi:serine protease inhibitor dipetalogastin-like [Diabrotica virgifera virgifera]|uniref:Kazal-like domain-containing protein n=1 Tax=Diabrotica virgifera virgifera TaxID=50390 RepID=A0ABM5L1F6_DIAVI|nr:serine protease inhibitor dipetalogastin-like [Diabrotica virgifera virgifera]